MGCTIQLPNLNKCYSHLFSKSVQATRLQKVIGFIGLFSLRVYKLIFCSMRAENVCTSVPNPPNPIMMLSCILKTRWKSLVIVCICFPKRRSAAIPTQSFPTIPTSVPPLYQWIDMIQNIFKFRRSFSQYNPFIIWTNQFSQQQMDEIIPRAWPEKQLSTKQMSEFEQLITKSVLSARQYRKLCQCIIRMKEEGVIKYQKQLQSIKIIKINQDDSDHSQSMREEWKEMLRLIAKNRSNQDPREKSYFKTEIMYQLGRIDYFLKYLDIPAQTNDIFLKQQAHEQIKVNYLIQKLENHISDKSNYKKKELESHRAGKRQEYKMANALNVVKSRAYFQMKRKKQIEPPKIENQIDALRRNRVNNLLCLQFHKCIP